MQQGGRTVDRHVVIYMCDVCGKCGMRDKNQDESAAAAGETDDG